MFSQQQPEFIVLDIETTGLYPQDGDRILEIALVRMKNFVVVDAFHSYVNPQRPLSKEAQRINNITEDMIEGAPYASQVLPEVLDFIQGGCIVAHNAKFDVDFIGYELSLAGRKIKDHTPIVDTLKMARGLVPSLRSYRLENLVRYFGIPIKETHRAEADVKLTAELFIRLVDLAKDQNLSAFKQIHAAFGIEKTKYSLNIEQQNVLF